MFLESAALAKVDLLVGHDKDASTLGVPKGAALSRSRSI